MPLVFIPTKKGEKMTLSYTKEKKDYTINDKQSGELKDKIVKMYDDFYLNLSPHIADYDKINKHIFGILREENPDNYLTSKMYELRETYISHLKNRCASSVESLFGIEGNTEIDQSNSNIMKAFIEDKLEKMDYLAEYDHFIPNYVDKGGAYSFVEWETIQKEVKRIVDVDITTGEEATPDSLPQNITKKRITKTITEYDGAKATSIDPYSIVFNKDKVKNWDSCEKIIKEWLTPEQILAIKEFKISKETKEKLLEIGKSSKSSITTDKPADTIAEEAIDNDRIEVLNFWGDLRLPDGTFLENWHCVVIGRMEIVRFCKNPYLENPITRCVFQDHPDTGREISPILVGIINNAKKSEVFKKVLKALDFSLNPHLFTKGKILKGNIEAKPGGTTELDADDLDQGNPIVYMIDGKGAPLNMEVMPQFDADIEASTGINKYLTGNVEGSKVDFATEAQGIMGGGETRINKDVDNINRNLTRNTVQKIANLHANMIEAPEQIKTRESGKVEFRQVTPDVIQGSYEFKVADAKQQALDKNKAKTTVEILKEIAQGNPKANIDEISKYALENICDIKDSSKFFKEEEEMQSPPPPPPEPNQFVADIASKTICSDNSYPDNVKLAMLQMLGLEPTQDFMKKLGEANAPAV